jgi:putative transcriptional regulator
MTAAEARARARVNRAKLNATTEADIERHAAENDVPGARWYPAPATVRQVYGLTQMEMAALLRVPVGTWRNWEQHRGCHDAAVQALLRLLAADPQAVRDMLATA